MTSHSVTVTSTSIQEFMNTGAASGQGPGVIETVEGFEGTSSLVAAQTQQSSFGEHLPGTKLRHRLGRLQAEMPVATVEGQSIAEAEFFYPYVFASSWLPSEGSEVSVGSGWRRELTSKEAEPFVRHTPNVSGAWILCELTSLYTDDGDRFASITFEVELRIQRQPTKGDSYLPTSVSAVGSADYNISEGWSPRGQFRMLEQTQLQGGRNRPGFSTEGWMDWVTRWRASAPR